MYLDTDSLNTILHTDKIKPQCESRKLTGVRLVSPVVSAWRSLLLLLLLLLSSEHLFKEVELCIDNIAQTEQQEKTSPIGEHCEQLPVEK